VTDNDESKKPGQVKPQSQEPAEDDKTDGTVTIELVKDSEDAATVMASLPWGKSGENLPGDRERTTAYTAEQMKEIAQEQPIDFQALREVQDARVPPSDEPTPPETPMKPLLDQSTPPERKDEPGEQQEPLVEVKNGTPVSSPPLRALLDETFQPWQPQPLRKTRSRFYMSLFIGSITIGILVVAIALSLRTEPEEVTAGSKAPSLPAPTATVADFVERYPGDAPLRMLYARLLVDAGDPKTATLHLLRAVELDPEMAEAYALLAKLYKELGRPDQAEEARKHFERLTAKPRGH
jgi:tetratricopeptide (TPR) repeat protein